MNDLRLNRKDGLFIAVCIIILAAGVWVGVKYFYKAFPEASVQFRYDREGSGQIAEGFLSTVGFKPPTDFKHASRFGYDGYAKTYLEKELGLEGAQKYLGHPIRLWYWQHRWFKPSTKEEFKIFVSPEGEVVRAEHQIEENAAGADLTEDSVRVIAEQFLFGVMKQNSATLTFIEAQRTGRPHRSDWILTYRHTGIEPVKGSEYRYKVGVIGDQIGSYEEFLKVPEAWSASYRRLRSFNDIAGMAAGLGLFLTAIAMAATFFLRTKRRDVQWRIAIWFGIVACALSLLNQLNELPLTLYRYDTTTSWPGFVVQTVLIGLLVAIGIGALIFLLTAAAETVYRQRYGNKLALRTMFTARAMRTKSAFKNILLGVTLTSFFFAYQIVFYLVGGKFGAWAPSDVPYDDLLNTAMPWLAVLAMGFFPAVSEEFISRMFSIPFLQRAFKNRYTWLAILIPAVIWGFGHSGYPNQPFWIRGAEVGIAGVIIGVIMLRFGILAALVWHYTVDALYTALLLFRSENPYFILTAAVATGLLVIPLLAALIAYLRKGSFLPEAGVLNSDIAPPIAEAEVIVSEKEKPSLAPVVSVHRPHSLARRVIAVALLGVGVAAVLLPVDKVGDFLAYPVPKEAAVKTFADSLRVLRWADPDTLKMAAFILDEENLGNRDDLIYLLKHSGSVTAFNQIADERLVVGRWLVCAWTPENRLRFRATVNAKNGKIESIYPWLPEEMPGDSLSEADARAMVERALTARGEDLSKLEPKDYRQDSRPKRLDHSFSYEARDGDPRNVAEAKYRRGGSVQGGYLAVGNCPSYKIPEAWQRERDATTSVEALQKWISSVLIGGLMVWVITILALRTRKGLVPWKKAFLLAVLPSAAAALAGINTFYLSQAYYFIRVETPWSVFRLESMVEWLISVAGSYLFFTIALAFFGGLFPDKAAWLHRHERRTAAMDVLLAAAAGIGAYMLVKSIEAWLGAWQPEWIPFAGWGVPDWFAAPLPVITMLRDSLLWMALVSMVLGAFAYLWSGSLRKPQWRVLLILAAVLMFLQGIDPDEWLFSMIYNSALIVCVWVVLRFIVSGGPTHFFGLVIGFTVYRMSALGFGSENSAVVMQSWIYIALAVTGFAWWLGLGFRRRLMSAK